MRSKLVFVSAAFLGLLVASACSSTDVTNNVSETDGGSSGSSGKRPLPGSSGDDPNEEPGDDAGKDGKDAGKGDGGSKDSKLPSTLLAGGDLVFIGVAGNDVVFADIGVTPTTLNAVPIAGGTPTKIVDLADDTYPVLRGGVVGLWTGVDEDTLVGTFNTWTRAQGMKTNVATNSYVGIFAATEDGARVAFSQNTTVTGGEATSTELGVRDTGGMTNVATLSGTDVNTGNAINLVAFVGNCEADLAFVGKTLFTAHCTGTADTSDAKLLMVPGVASPTVTRLDGAAGAAPSLVPFWMTDDAGTKVFVVENANSAGKLITIATTTKANIDTNIVNGYVLGDGSGVVYQTTSGDLKKWTTSGSSVALSSGAKAILGRSRDNKRVAFRKLAAAQTGATDLHVVDHSAAAPSVVTIDATASVLASGFNSASTHFVFLGDIAGGTAKVKSVPVAGGAAIELAPSAIGASTTLESNGVLFISNPGEFGPAGQEFSIYQVNYVDSVSGTPMVIRNGIPEGEFEVKGKSFVYAHAANQGSGIYVATLP